MSLCSRPAAPSVAAAAAPVRTRTERKVVMQQLQMSMHNQMMVKDMLRDLHIGDEEEEAAGNEWDGNDDSADLRWMPVGDVETYVLLYTPFGRKCHHYFGTY